MTRIIKILKMRTVFLFSLCLVVIGCTTPTEPGLCILDPVHLDMPYLAAPGGQCVQACAAMTASYVYKIQPTATMLQDQTTWLTQQKHQITVPQIISLFQDYWHLTRSHYQRSSLQDLYLLLQQDIPVVVLIDGWEHMLHAVVLTGMDPAYVYVQDPARGLVTYPHTTFQALRAVAENGVVVVRK